MPGLEAHLDDDFLGNFEEAAKEFAGSPGYVSDENVQIFLSAYPLPTLFRILGLSGTGSSLESSTILSFNRILRSNAVSELWPDILSNAKLALKATSPSIRQLACQAVGMAVEGGREIEGDDVADDVILALGDSQLEVAMAASETLKKMAKEEWGLDLIFRRNQLSEMLSQSSSTVRMRVYSVAVSISEFSEKAKTEVRKSEILKNLSREVLLSESDPLTAVSAIEIIGELASSRNGTELMEEGDFLSRLCGVIRSPDSSKTVRMAGMAVTGQLAGATVSQQEICLVSDTLHQVLDSWRRGEREGETGREEEIVAAIDAVGQLGTSVRGAEAVLTRHPSPACHVAGGVVDAHGTEALHLAAVHALASLLGAERGGGGVEGEEGREIPLLSSRAEENLSQLVLSQAATSAWGPTLSGVILSLLRQTEEMRIATYRLLSVLVCRFWAISGICGSRDIVTLVTDSRTETNRPAMEWRHSCCVSILSAAQKDEKKGQFVPPDVISLLDAAIRRGPFLSETERREAIPIVATAERM